MPAHRSAKSTAPPTTSESKHTIQQSISSTQSAVRRYGDQGDGSYVNPILYADYSDPDVIAIGEDYYLTASSFNCMPGLPLLHSRDLVNWTLIGYALKRFPDPSYDQPRPGAGVWAPSIRFHAGKYWIFFATPDEGIFMIQATDPRGDWSPPHCVQPGCGMIDPCPFWDDGAAYLVRAQAASRCKGENSLLTLHRISPDGTRLLDAGRVVIDGHHHHPIIEGPKLYKRNGWYYIFAPAGGVKGGWQAVFRSRNIEGPYEDRIALIQGNTDVNGPHQGGWVETPHGEHWFIHFQDRGAYGRVVHLQPLRWEDDWPLIGVESRARMVFEPALRHAKPRMNHPAPPTRIPASDNFNAPALGLQWQWNANPNPNWLALPGGKLRLFSQGTPSGNSDWREAGNILLQKPHDMAFRVTVRVALAPAAPGDHAGLILTGGLSAALVLETVSTEDEKNSVRFQLTLYEMRLECDAAPTPHAALALDRNHVRLRLEMIDGSCRFAYSAHPAINPDCAEFTLIGKPVQPASAAWLGARIGLFCLNPGARPSGGHADFANFDYEQL